VTPMDEFRFPLPSDTAHVRIESRQYRIFKLDLGEGVPRRKLAVGAVIILPYWLILGVIFGLSPLAGQGKGGIAYIAPAALLVFLALTPDEGGRASYVLLLDRIRFFLRRFTPMIASPIARPTPGRPFIVTARWSVIDPAASRKLRKTLQAIDHQHALAAAAESTPHHSQFTSTSTSTKQRRSQR
jgi:hypothetical protein